MTSQHPRRNVAQYPSTPHPSTPHRNRPIQRSSSSTAEESYSTARSPTDQPTTFQKTFSAQHYTIYQCTNIAVRGGGGDHHHHRRRRRRRRHHRSPPKSVESLTRTGGSSGRPEAKPNGGMKVKTPPPSYPPRTGWNFRVTFASARRCECVSHSDPEPELDRVSSKIRLRNRGEPRERTRLGPDVTALAAPQQRESLLRSPAQWVALGMVRCRGGSRSTIIVVARRARVRV